MRVEDIGRVSKVDEKINFHTDEERKRALTEVTCQGAPIFGEEVISYLEENGFFKAPASRNYHGSYAGGLFDHSFNVACQLQSLTNKMELHWQSAASPFIVGILHDLCKIDQYKAEEDGYAWNTEPIVKGHGVKSVIYAQNLFKLTEEEQACILYHMGAFTSKDEWSNYTDAIAKYPNVLFTHTADMIADKILGV